MRWAAGHNQSYTTMVPTVGQPPGLQESESSLNLDCIFPRTSAGMHQGPFYRALEPCDTRGITALEERLSTHDCMLDDTRQGNNPSFSPHMCPQGING